MNFKEAIKRIKAIRWEHATNACPDREALDLAIAALEFTNNLTDQIADLIVANGCKDLDDFCEKYGIPNPSEVDK